MNIHFLFELKSKYITREIGDELVLVPLSGNVAQMNVLFTLNETGKFIWEQLDGKNTMEDIIALLVQEFDVEAETAKIDVETFLNKIAATLK